MQVFDIHMKEVYPFLGENGCDPVLTVYLPSPITEMNWKDKTRKCILICPGGGYGFVSEREGEPIALKFAAEGYNAFVLKYSIAPHKFPTAIREAAAAMELIYANAAAWKCETDHVAIIGFSAGGHLAGHYTNCFDCPEVREVFPESKAVNASILCYPVITSDPRHSHAGSFRNLSGHQELTNEDHEMFSLERKVTPNTPPTFLWHTAPDDCVPVMNCLLYAQALAANKVPFTVHIYPDGWHGLATVDDTTNNPLPEKIAQANGWLDAAYLWLKTVFA
jgi:acetyl esterase/lipase